MNRPPMERTRGTVQLFRKAQKLAAQLDWTLTEAGTGAPPMETSLQPWASPLLMHGAVGEGAHAAHESILIDELAPRTAS